METIAAVKVHVKFLNSNSTSHPWAFGAFAELIDNSYDAKSREVQIEKLDLDGMTCLSFQDDGSGMDKEHLHNMLSFGFCDRVLSTAIGHYGNGFKSSSMRLGKDALVFTRTKDSAGVGLLSQTYNEDINADSLRLPMLHYELSELIYEEENADQSENLSAILKYSPFKEEEMLKKELRQLPKTGTRIIIYNLKKNETEFELDFESNPEDIICGEFLGAGGHNRLTYRSSLREYCSILYLHPRMKIKLREKYVKTKLVAKSLCNSKTDSYAPKQELRKVDITFGFVPESERSEDYGMMLYTDNRLIKPYEQVSCQKQGKGIGAYVVGITQAKFLTPTHSKQGFEEDKKYIQAMISYNIKLKNYWETTTQESSSTCGRKCPDTDWVQCDFKSCLKWRRLPQRTNVASLPKKWYCYLHPDNIDCKFPEDTHDEDEQMIQTRPKRLLIKRKSTPNPTEIINGKGGKRKNVAVSIDSFNADESENHEETLNISGSSIFPPTLNMPSTSSARKSVQKDTPSLRTRKTAPDSSSKKTCLINHGGKTAETMAATTLKRNSHRQSSFKAVLHETSSDIGHGTDDNNETSIDNGQGSDDNHEMSLDNGLGTDDSYERSLDNRLRADDKHETSPDIEQVTIDSSSTSLDIGQGPNNSSDTAFSVTKQERNEIAELRNNLAELTARFDALLGNSKKLLEMLAPDVPLTDDVDIEKLIAQMIEDGFDD